MDKVKEANQLVDDLLLRNKPQIKEAEKMVDSLLGEETVYQAWVKKKMEEEGIKSPAELSAEKKKEFFAKLKAGWAAEKSK